MNRTIGNITRIFSCLAIAGTLIAKNPDYSEQHIANFQEQVNQSSTAILLIDMQDKFLQHISEGERETETQNQIDVIRYAQENRIPIYVIEYEGMGPTTETLSRVLEQGPYIRIIKPQDNAFRDTDLDENLTHNKISNLVLMGINASVCVSYTARTAHERGYDITTSLDLIADPPEQKALYLTPEGYEGQWLFRTYGVLQANHDDVIESLVPR